MKKNKILVLNYSHPSKMSRYLISSLQHKGWDCPSLYPDSKYFYKYFALLLSFHINLDKWKTHFDRKISMHFQSPSTFIKMTTYFNNRLKKYNGNYDLVFQFSSKYSHYLDKAKKPYVVFVDWTRNLSQREYTGWTPVEPASKVKKWIELEGNLYRNASRVFTPSNYTRNSLIKDYNVNDDKAVTVGYGPTLQKIPSEAYRKKYDKKTVLFIGYDFQRKGGFYLLEAFKKVKREINDARLVVVTSGKLKDKVVGEDVIFINSKTSRSEILKLYNNASLFVMPSLCEPFGLVFLEAMAYKLPCIGTSADAMPEIIEDGKTGFLVPAKDSDILAEKMIFLLNNPGLIIKMGEAGYTRLKQKFTWDKVATTIDYHLNLILNGKN